MENTEITNLMAARPNVYGWLGFQRFWLRIFLMLGLILSFNTVYIVSCGIIKYYLIDKASAEFAEAYHINQADMQEFLTEHLEPIKYKAILYSFFLSLSFFIIARYCQKTLNRNRYIMRLEEELKKIQQ
jgi:hypothetical protein